MWKGLYKVQHILSKAVVLILGVVQASGYLSLVCFLYVCLKVKNVPAEGASHIHYFKINNQTLIYIYYGMISFLRNNGISGT